jgi:hypothetical protein
MTEVEILRLARVIHMARVEECSFKRHPGYTGYEATLARMPWPEDRKEAARLIQAGQSWMDLAIAQARAVARALAQGPSA